jgi:hypothetical protein
MELLTPIATAIGIIVVPSLPCADIANDNDDDGIVATTGGTIATHDIDL